MSRDPGGVVKEADFHGSCKDRTLARAKQVSILSEVLIIAWEYMETRLW
jgi:hypothetical protein